MLLEAMVAITVAIVGLVGIFALLSQSLGLHKVAADQYVAANLAAEGIEVAKNVIDANAVKGGVPWNDGVSNGSFEVQFNSVSLGSLSGSPLSFDSTSGMYRYDAGSPTNFYRTIVIDTKPGANEIQVDSIVKWKSRGGAQFSIDVEDHFFNWR